MKTIRKNIAAVLGCGEKEISDFRKINKGLTNSSFSFNVRGEKFVYRMPGEGTEKLINRKNEKRSLEIAKAGGIDPTYIFMDENEGWKISHYVENFREPDYYSDEDSERVIELMHTLHSMPVKTEYGFDPWDDLKRLEKLIEEISPGCLMKYAELREKTDRLYKQTEGDGTEKCFCHGDTYRHNWMLTESGGTILIDWEYAGYSDPGIDVGYYIIDAGYEIEEAKHFIERYLCKTDKGSVFHFLCYSAIMAYYWFVWAVYRELCGFSTDGAREAWEKMAYRYAEALTQDI